MLIWVVLPCWVVIRRLRRIIGGSVRHGDRTDVLGKRTGVSNTGESQRAPESTTPLRQREASRIRMQVRSPARQSAARIGLEPEIIPGAGHDEPHQLGGRRASAATDTCTRWKRTHRADHSKVYPARLPDAYPVSFPPQPHPDLTRRPVRCPDGYRCATR